MQASVKEDRQNWIGGSDIPIILGISPFTTRYDLLLFKAGLIEQEFEGNEYTEYGNTMESKIRDYINESQTREFIETKYEYRATGIRCHLDGEDKKGVLEVKTTSKIHEDIKEYKIYLVQLLFYMMNVGKNNGMLAVYERPEDFNTDFDKERLHTYQIDINDYQDMVNEIKVGVEQFKIDLQKLKENPLMSEEDFIPVDIRIIGNKIVEIEERLLEFKELEKQQKELKTKLFQAMEENGIKKWITNNGIQITRVASTPDKTEMVFNEDKLKEEQPLIYANYCEEKIKKGKAGYIKIT